MLLSKFLEACKDLGIVDRYKVTSSMGSVTQGEVTTYFMQKNNGAFLFSSADPTFAEEIYSNRIKHVLTAKLANALCGKTDASFLGKTYKSVTVYPTRVIGNDVEFCTAKGTKFIVSQNEPRATLGLYDILYENNAEHGIMELPKLHVDNPVSLANSYGVTLRGHLLCSDAACSYGDNLVLPTEGKTNSLINEFLGNTAVEPGVTLDKLFSCVEDSVLGLGEAGYTLSLKSNLDGVNYVAELTCSIPTEAVTAMVEESGSSMFHLKSGVHVKPESLKAFASMFRDIKSNLLLCSDNRFESKSYDGDSAKKLGEHWLGQNVTFKKVTSTIVDI